MDRTGFLAALFGSLFVSCALAADVRIQLENGAFKLTGVPNLTEPSGGWASIFFVTTSAENGPPMFGTYSIEREALIFHPRFPLANGVRYRAVYRPSPGAKGEAPVEVWFDGPVPSATPQARVTHVYPTTEVWPANQLRFYVYFSAPMRRGEVWNHIRLIGDGGSVVPLAFLEIEPELWDASNQRLTVLFDPGRIKRGVAPERELGPPIVEGHRYTLEVNRELLDASGRPLAAEFRKEFRGGAPVRSAIDPKDWRVSPPSSNSTEPLTVDFPRPLDYALLEHAITVRAATVRADLLARDLAGVVAIERSETRWSFIPAQRWTTGDYELVIDPALEDAAGNRIGRPFEVDLHGPRIPALTSSVPLGFRVP